MHTDNPAGRLLNILSEGKKRQVGSPSKTVWSELLEVESGNLPLLMSRLGKVMELPEQIINDIQTHYPNQNNTHKHWSTKVNTAFSKQNLNGSWQEFIRHIDSHTIDYLSMSVDLLDSKENTQVLSTEKLTEIHEKINGLLIEVMDMDLDESFKKYIVGYLRKIIISIEEYKISGATPIVESIESILGHAFIDENYRKNIVETDFGTKLITTLSAVASVVTIAVGLPQLPETFQFLLGAPSK